MSKVCLFPVDSRFDAQGFEIHRDKTICSHSEDTVKVSQEHPNEFIPFLSINPLRKNALDLLDEYHKKGCRGAKFMQNYWGIDLNDKKFIPYYKKLKKLNLPLVIHIGCEFTIESFRKFESPRMLTLPLETGVNVVAAHVGLGRFDHKILFWRNFSKKEQYINKEYFEVIEMLKRYPNLYADISAILSLNKTRALPHLAKQTDIHDRLIFGTDYPVPFVVNSFLLNLPKDKIKIIKSIKNPFDRYYEVIKEYFGEDNPIFTNYKKLI